MSINFINYLEAIGSYYNLDDKTINEFKKLNSLNFFDIVTNVYVLKKFVDFTNKAIDNQDFILNLKIHSSSSGLSKEVSNLLNDLLKNKKNINQIKNELSDVIYQHYIKNYDYEGLRRSKNEEYNRSERKEYLKDIFEEFENSLNEIFEEDILPKLDINVYHDDQIISDIKFQLESNYIEYFDSIKHEIFHFFSDPTVYTKFIEQNKLKKNSFKKSEEYSLEELLKELHALQGSFIRKPSDNEVNTSKFGGKRRPFDTTTDYKIMNKIIESLKNKDILNHKPQWKDLREELKEYKTFLNIFKNQKDNDFIEESDLNLLNKKIINYSKIAYNLYGTDQDKISNFEAKLDFAIYQTYRFIKNYRNIKTGNIYYLRLFKKIFFKTA